MERLKKYTGIYQQLHKIILFSFSFQWLAKCGAFCDADAQGERVMEGEGKKGCYISGSPYIRHKKNPRSRAGTHSFSVALGCPPEQATSKVPSLMLPLVHKP